MDNIPSNDYWNCKCGWFPILDCILHSKYNTFQGEHKKDIQKVDVEINGQKQTYTYDTLENKPNAEGTWEIGVRISDEYYKTEYTRELYKSDYLFKASRYDSGSIYMNAMVITNQKQFDRYTKNKKKGA